MAPFVRCLLFLAALGGGHARPLFATSITAINLQRHLVYIDIGIVGGYAEGTKVCFVVDDNTLICGLVSQAALYKAQVTVEEELATLFAAFKKNPESIGIKRVNPQAPVEVETTEKNHKIILKKVRATAKSAAGSWLSLHLLWEPTFNSLSSLSYQELNYLGSDSATGDPLWVTSNSSFTFLPMSFGGELSLLRLAGLTVGANYKSKALGPISAYYDNPDTGTMSIVTMTTSTESSAYMDLGLHFSEELTLGLGLEYASTAVHFTGTRQDDSGTAADYLLYEYLGSASLLNLRIPLRWKYPLLDEPLHLGLLLGVTAKVKLATLRATTDPYADDVLNGNKSDDAYGEFVADFAFIPNSFAAELMLGTTVTF